jgi:hypothetical protein
MPLVVGTQANVLCIYIYLCTYVHVYQYTYLYKYVHNVHKYIQTHT